MSEKPPQISLFTNPPESKRQADALSTAEAIRPARASVRIVEAPRPAPYTAQEAPYIPKKVIQEKPYNPIEVVIPDKMPIMATYALTVVHYFATFTLAAFNCIFFVQFAGDSFLLQIIFGVTAIIFAFGEVGLWERGLWTPGKVGSVYKWCAVGLAFFSFIGGAAASLGEVSAYTIAKVDTIAIDSEIIALDRRQVELEKQRSELPATWITRTKELDSEIDRLSEKRMALRDKKDKGSKAEATAGESIQVFVIMANLFKTSVGNVALIFLLFRSLMIEVVALATSKTPRKKNVD